MDATRHCLQCEHDFCAECFAELHAKTNPRMRFHKFQVIQDVHAKVKQQFEWPQDRPIEAGISTTEAFRRATALLDEVSVQRFCSLLLRCTACCRIFVVSLSRSLIADSLE